MNERELRALEMKDVGSAFKEIGEVFGVSASRASQVFHKAKG